MSCEMVVWEGVEPLDDDDRADIVNAIGTCYLEARVGTRQPPTPRISRFVDALLQRWPDIGRPDSAWTRGVTQYACGPAVAVAVSYSRADEMDAHVRELAEKHDLQYYFRG